MAETLGQAVLEVGIDDSRLRAGLKGVEQQVTKTNTVVRALGSALAGISAVAIFQDLIKSATELENITRKLTNTLGDQGAQQAIGFLRGLSDSLGLSFNVLADSFGSFTAAASAANIPLSEQKDLFAAVATSGQRLGLTNDAISGSLIALQQIASKGVVSQEELRQQLGERLPIATAAAAIGLGVTSKELITLVESGKLTADVFFPAITKGLNELNGNGTGSVPTATQNFASFGNELEKLKAQVGTEFLPSVVEGVQELSKALGGLNVQIQANKLGLGGGALQNLVGFTPTQGAQAVGTLQQLANTYGLSQKQARALFTDAVKGVGASTDAFGRLNLTAEQYEKILSQLPGRAAAFTKEGRASAALAQQKLEDDRKANAEGEKQLNTIGKIEERLKVLRKENKGLDFGSSKFAANEEEIASLEAQTAKGAKKLEDAGVKIKEEITKGAERLEQAFDKYESALKADQAAREAAANAVLAGSDIASAQGIRNSRQTLIDDIEANLTSDNIDRAKAANKFGFGFSQGSSGTITDGNGFTRSFNSQASISGLERLTNEQLQKVSTETSRLADAQGSVIDAQTNLTEATKELKAQLELANGRESNLAITVPVGKTETVYLP